MSDLLDNKIKYYFEKNMLEVLVHHLVIPFVMTIIPILIGVAFLTLLERKVLKSIQKSKGPNKKEVLIGAVLLENFEEIETSHSSQSIEALISEALETLPFKTALSIYYDLGFKIIVTLLLLILIFFFIVKITCRFIKILFNFKKEFIEGSFLKIPQLLSFFLSFFLFLFSLFFFYNFKIGAYGVEKVTKFFAFPAPIIEFIKNNYSDLAHIPYITGIGLNTEQSYSVGEICATIILENIIAVQIIGVYSFLLFVVPSFLTYINSFLTVYILFPMRGKRIEEEKKFGENFVLIENQNKNDFNLIEQQERLLLEHKQNVLLLEYHPEALRSDLKPNPVLGLNVLNYDPKESIKIDKGFFLENNHSLYEYKSSGLLLLEYKRPLLLEYKMPLLLEYKKVPQLLHNQLYKAPEPLHNQLEYSSNKLINDNFLLMKNIENIKLNLERDFLSHMLRKEFTFQDHLNDLGKDYSLLQILQGRTFNNLSQYLTKNRGLVLLSDLSIDLAKPCDKFGFNFNLYCEGEREKTLEIRKQVFEFLLQEADSNIIIDPRMKSLLLSKFKFFLNLDFNESDEVLNSLKYKPYNKLQEDAKYHYNCSELIDEYFFYRLYSGKTLNLSLFNNLSRSLINLKTNIYMDKEVSFFLELYKMHLKFVNHLHIRTFTGKEQGAINECKDEYLIFFKDKIPFNDFVQISWFRDLLTRSLGFRRGNPNLGYSEFVKGSDEAYSFYHPFRYIYKHIKTSYCYNQNLPIRLKNDLYADQISLGSNFVEERIRNKLQNKPYIEKKTLNYILENNLKIHDIFTGSSSFRKMPLPIKTNIYQSMKEFWFLNQDMVVITMYNSQLRKNELYLLSDPKSVFKHRFLLDICKDIQALNNAKIFNMEPPIQENLSFIPMLPYQDVDGFFKMIDMISKYMS